jgi:hypothetical protein
MAGVELLVDLKIQGIPEERILIGSFADVDLAQAGWDQFLAYLVAHTHDPGR